MPIKRQPKVAVKPANGEPKPRERKPTATVILHDVPRGYDWGWFEPEPSAMAIVLSDVPGGIDWGWFAREDPRMHIQTVDRKDHTHYKIWLEEKGKPVFQPVGKIPAKILKRVEAEAARLRLHIEARWVNFMIDCQWLELRVAGTRVTLIAYPHTPNLADLFIPQVASQIRPEIVTLNNEMAALEIFRDRTEDRRHHLRLSTILWPRPDQE
jgi:hypothetical protein